ncbi:unnamed protein product [Darwinula stevensoni]|uniref:Smoothelin domain-containing protein n=1 Tax=Darwinula stevensoni TaxID=69355 RepID=A0A7R8ZYQ8_9CRUS|nr:unnamed protein product [Darwinula stevensoni]CAG0881998.1 unnamed protein product [Darwinula stevensoni]
MLVLEKGRDEGPSYVSPLTPADLRKGYSAPYPFQTTTTSVTETSTPVLVQGIDISSFHDIEQLKSLLNKCQEYEDRRLVRERIRTLSKKTGTSELHHHHHHHHHPERVGSSPVRVVKSPLDSNRQPFQSSQGESTPLTPLICDQLRFSLQEALLRKGGGNTITFPLPNLGNPNASGAEESLFDSGTESGDDPGSDRGEELSHFMEGIQESLCQSDRTLDTGILNDVEHVLNRLKFSLRSAMTEADSAHADQFNLVTKDGPTSEKWTLSTEQGSELLALIDRLQGSLETMCQRPTAQPDIVPSSSQTSMDSDCLVTTGRLTFPVGPEAMNVHGRGDSSNLGINSPGEGTNNSNQKNLPPWKIRVARRRAMARSHTLGGDGEEELSAVQSVLQTQTSSKNPPPWNSFSTTCNPKPFRRVNLSDSIPHSKSLDSVFSKLQIWQLPDGKTGIDVDEDYGQSAISKLYPPVKSSSIDLHRQQSDQKRASLQLRRQNSFDSGDEADRSKDTTGDELDYEMPDLIPHSLKKGSNDTFKAFGMNKAEAEKPTLMPTVVDPSEMLFTPEQTVKIAIHKAAINKQLSVDESSKSMDEPEHVSQEEKASGYSTVSQDLSDKRSQFLLSQLSDADMRLGSQFSEKTDTQSGKPPFLSKMENKKKARRSQTAVVQRQHLDSDDARREDVRSDAEDNHPVKFTPKTTGDAKFASFLKRSGQAEERVISKPAYLASAEKDRNWKNRYSNLKHAFEGPQDTESMSRASASVPPSPTVHKNMWVSSEKKAEPLVQSKSARHEEVEHSTVGSQTKKMTEKLLAEAEAQKVVMPVKKQSTSKWPPVFSKPEPAVQPTRSSSVPPVSFNRPLAISAEDKKPEPVESNKSWRPQNVPYTPTSIVAKRCEKINSGSRAETSPTPPKTPWNSQSLVAARVKFPSQSNISNVKPVFLQSSHPETRAVKDFSAMISSSSQPPSPAPIKKFQPAQAFDSYRPQSVQMQPQPWSTRDLEPGTQTHTKPQSTTHGEPLIKAQGKSIYDHGLAPQVQPRLAHRQEPSQSHSYHNEPLRTLPHPYHHENQPRTQPHPPYHEHQRQTQPLPSYHETQPRRQSQPTYHNDNQHRAQSHLTHHDYQRQTQPLASHQHETQPRTQPTYHNDNQHRAQPHLAHHDYQRQTQPLASYQHENQPRIQPNNRNEAAALEDSMHQQESSTQQQSSAASTPCSEMSFDAELPPPVVRIAGQDKKYGAVSHNPVDSSRVPGMLLQNSMLGKPGPGVAHGSSCSDKAVSPLNSSVSRKPGPVSVSSTATAGIPNYGPGQHSPFSVKTQVQNSASPRKSVPSPVVVKSDPSIVSNINRSPNQSQKVVRQDKPSFESNVPAPQDRGVPSPRRTTLSGTKSQSLELVQRVQETRKQQEVPDTSRNRSVGKLTRPQSLLIPDESSRSRSRSRSPKSPAYIPPRQFEARLDSETVISKRQAVEAFFSGQQLQKSSSQPLVRLQRQDTVEREFEELVQEADEKASIWQSRSLDTGTSTHHAHIVRKWLQDNFSSSGNATTTATSTSTTTTTSTSTSSSTPCTKPLVVERCPSMEKGRLVEEASQKEGIASLRLYVTPTGDGDNCLALFPDRKDIHRNSEDDTDGSDDIIGGKQGFFKGDREGGVFVEDDGEQIFFRRDQVFF